MAKKKPQHGGAREGAGRKVASPDGKAIPLVASVPEGLVDGLKAHAAAKGWTVSQAVTEAVRALLGRKKVR